MAAPTHGTTESVRIRIKLDTSNTSATILSTQFWMLVQESPTLSTISDLEMQIVDRFNLATHSIQLCLERFLLPSFESVRILRENDLLSVQDFITIKGDGNRQGIKPRAETEEHQLEAGSCTDEQAAPGRQKNKKRRKRHHSESNGHATDLQEGVSERHSRRHKTDDAAVKTKKSFKDSTIKQTDQLVGERTMKKLEAVRMVTGQIDSVSVEQLVAKRDCVNQRGADASLEIDGVNTKKRRHRRHKPRGPPVDVSPPTNLDLVCNDKPKIPASQTIIPKPIRFRPVEKGHVHFDSDKSEDETGNAVSNGVDTKTHIAAVTDMAAMTDMAAVTNMAAVTDMQSNKRHSEMVTPSKHPSQQSHNNGDVTASYQPVNGGGNVKVFFRRKQTSGPLLHTEANMPAVHGASSLVSLAAQVKERDYSTYSLLHGPPRPGDKIAYKLLELSETYNPEVSNYREAQVISYDPSTQTMDVDNLGKDTVRRKPGKFDLIQEDDIEALPNTEDTGLKMELSWSSLIEPRLLV